MRVIDRQIRGLYLCLIFCFSFPCLPSRVFLPLLRKAVKSSNLGYSITSGIKEDERDPGIRLSVL